MRSLMIVPALAAAAMLSTASAADSDNGKNLSSTDNSSQTTVDGPHANDETSRSAVKEPASSSRSSDGAMSAGGSSSGSQPANHKPMLAVVTLYDTNGDGKIDAKEIEQITDKNVHDYVMYFDRDHDGVIDAFEAQRATANEQIDQLMAKWDKNDNGQLDKDELQSISDAKLHQFVSALDKNHDGILSRDELLGEYADTAQPKADDSKQQMQTKEKEGDGGTTGNAGK